MTPTPLTLYRFIFCLIVAIGCNNVDETSREVQELKDELARLKAEDQEVSDRNAAGTAVAPQPQPQPQPGTAFKPATNDVADSAPRVDPIKSMLNAYLDADDWRGRHQFVANPKEAASYMPLYYKDYFEKLASGELDKMGVDSEIGRASCRERV